MKVYRVSPDVNKFQYFLLDDHECGLTKMMDFDCTPKTEEWVAPAVYTFNPKRTNGNFPALCATATLVVDEVALKQLADLLEMSGELLPLPHNGSIYHVLNVTDCVNALDERKTQWRYEQNSGPIETYHFHARRLPETPLFKIPETYRTEILTIEGQKDPDDEFKGRVERLGLKGLVFEELWSDEQ